MGQDALKRSRGDRLLTAFFKVLHPTLFALMISACLYRSGMDWLNGFVARVNSTLASWINLVLRRVA